MNLNNSYTAPIITPENLIDITIQYRLPNGGGQNSTPTIFLRYGLINVQSKRIAIQEMKPYIGYLQIRGAVEGKNVIATQFTNFRTVISLGNEAGAGFPLSVQVSNGGDPCAAIPTVYYIDHAGDFAPTDVIYTDSALAVPLTGFTLIASTISGIVYALNTLTGVVGAATGASCVVPPSAFAKVITFKINGVNIDGTNVLTNMLNGAVPNLFTFNSQALGAWCELEIPSPSDCILNFEDEFQVSGIGGSMYVRPFRSSPAGTPGNSWIIEFFDFNAANPVINIDFIHNDIVEVANVNNGAAQSLEFCFYKNAFNTLYSVDFVGGVNARRFITRDTEIYPVAFAQASLAGIWNVEKYDINGVLLSTQYNVCSAQGTVTIPGACVRLVFKYKMLTFSNNVVGSTNKITISDFSVSGYGFALIYNETGAPTYLRYPKGLNTANALGVHVNDVALLPFNLSFYKLGALVNTVVVNTQEFSAVATDNDWDALVFGTATPPGSTLGVVNQMGVAPQETTQIDSVQFISGGAVVVPAFPVLPLQNSTGSFVGNAVDTVGVTISNTGIITPTTIRVTDAGGVDHDQAYVADGIYNFAAINTVGLVTVTLF